MKRNTASARLTCHLRKRPPKPAGAKSPKLPLIRLSPCLAGTRSPDKTHPHTRIERTKPFPFEPVRKPSVGHPSLSPLPRPGPFLTPWRCLGKHVEPSPRLEIRKRALEHLAIRSGSDNCSVTGHPGVPEMFPGVCLRAPRESGAGSRSPKRAKVDKPDEALWDGLKLADIRQHGRPPSRPVSGASISNAPVSASSPRPRSRPHSAENLQSLGRPPCDQAAAGTVLRGPR
jgi:hypothetical protein